MRSEQLEILSEVGESLGKVYGLVSGAAYELTGINVRQLSAAADLLRLLAERLDELANDGGLHG